MWVGGKGDVHAIADCARISSICAVVLSSTICTSWLVPSNFRLSFSLRLDYLTGALVLYLLHFLRLSLRLRILWVRIALTAFLIGCWWMLLWLIAFFISFISISWLRCVLHHRRPLFLQPAC